MKNDKKNPIYPSVPFSCMLEQLMTTFQHKSYKWHLNIHIWSLNLNLGLKQTSFNLVASCISSNQIILPCHDYASYCCIALIVFFLVCRYLSPLSRCCSDDEFVDTDEELLLSTEVPGKQNPLVHCDTILLSRACSLIMHQENTDFSVTCCGS